MPAGTFERCEAMREKTGENVERFENSRQNWSRGTLDQV